MSALHPTLHLHAIGLMSGPRRSDKGKELLSKRSCHAGQVDEVGAIPSRFCGTLAILWHTAHSGLSVQLRQMDRERRWQEAAQKEKMAAKMENIFEQDVTAFKCAEVWT